MAAKSWEGKAEELRLKPGFWELVTRAHPDTALNPDRLEYLRERALAVGLKAEIRPLQQGRRPQGLWVCWDSDAVDLGIKSR